MTESMNKAQRLAVAGVVAPHLREQSDKAAKRRVARVDKDGNVVGYTTLAEVQRALLERQKIELEVIDGVRPKEIVCAQCGRADRVARTGKLQKMQTMPRLQLHPMRQATGRVRRRYVPHVLQRRSLDRHPLRAMRR